MKRDLLTWNETADEALRAKTTQRAEVSPADPEPQFWYDTSAYQAYLPAWKDRWEFKSYLERHNKPKKALRAKR